MGIDDARIASGQSRMLFDSEADVGTASPSHPGMAVALGEVKRCAPACEDKSATAGKCPTRRMPSEQRIVFPSSAVNDAPRTLEIRGGTRGKQAHANNEDSAVYLWLGRIGQFFALLKNARGPGVLCVSSPGQHEHQEDAQQEPHDLLPRFLAFFARFLPASFTLAGIWIGRALAGCPIDEPARSFKVYKNLSMNSFPMSVESAPAMSLRRIMRSQSRVRSSLKEMATSSISSIVSGRLIGHAPDAALLCGP